MKKNKLLFVVASSLLIVGCGNSGPKLGKVALKLNNDKTGLVWDAIEGAESYQIKVNDLEPVSGDSYYFDLVSGIYSVQVRAVKGKTYGEYSDAFTYTSKEAHLGELFADGLTVTWGDTTDCNYVTASLNGSEPVNAVDSYVASENGIVTISAVGGYNEATSTFYAVAPGERLSSSIFVSKVGLDELVLEDGEEDGNTELQEQYTVQKYENNRWNDSSASIELSNMNQGINEGRCVQYNYWKHSAYFKYAKEIEIDGSYDTLSLYLKGDGASTVSLIFDVTETTVIGGLDLTGVFITYPISVVSTNWTQYNISLYDTNWKIDYGGTKLPFSDALAMIKTAGYKAESMMDLFQYFTAFEVRPMCIADDNWSSTKMWADEIKLMNTGIKDTSTKTLTKFDDCYAIRSDDIKGKMTKTSSNTYDFDGTVLGGHYSFLINATADGKGGFDLVANFDAGNFKANVKLDTDGVTYVLNSVEGSLAGFFTNFKMAPITIVDDFESYTETGVGYDSNHNSKEGRSGLRANYFSDYYSGGSGSPVGGSGWALMGSSDYLNLATNQNNGKDSGSKAAKVKFNSGAAMRMMTWQLVDGATKGLGQGTTFSFLAKGTDVNVSYKLRVYYVTKVTPTNHTSGESSVDAYTSSPVTIPANSDWTEYTLQIDPKKMVYGFAFFPQATNNGAQYIMFDNAMIYSTVSPY